MPLESDTPHADAQLQATFYEYQGDDMFKGRVHVRIIAPGDKILINDRLANDDDKRRFQREWLHYIMKNTEEQVIGTPLSVWRTERPEEVTDGQLQELLILKFTSVEQVAMASDQIINRIGMGAVGLRERARSYLSGKNAQASGAELQEAKSEIAAMKAMMEKMMLAMQTPAPAAVAPPAPEPSPMRSYKPRKPARRAKAKRVSNPVTPTAAPLEA